MCDWLNRWLIRRGIVVGCRTGNSVRDCRQVSPATGSGNNTSRDVVIETVHARHADTLPHVTNNCAAQGISRFRYNSVIFYLQLYSCLYSLGMNERNIFIICGSQPSGWIKT